MHIDDSVGSSSERSEHHLSEGPRYDEEEEGKRERSAFDGDLDDFLGQLHETTKTGEENGMPELSWLKDNFKTKSGAIRYLYQAGYDIHKIAAHLGLKYQHVYNVTHQNLKRGPNEVYIEREWQCPHTKAPIIIDVVARKGVRDPDSSRVLYRVCSDCARNLIPGVSKESIDRVLPGTK